MNAADNLRWDIAKHKAKVYKWCSERPQPMTLDDKVEYFDRMGRVFDVEDSLRLSFVDGYTESLQEIGYSEREIDLLVFKEEKLMRYLGDLRVAVEMKELGVKADKISNYVDLTPDVINSADRNTVLSYDNDDQTNIAAAPNSPSPKFNPYNL